MKLFRNKYRIESARLKGWDYSAPGWYFVTICTREAKRCFGEVKNGKMHLSTMGEIVAEEWKKAEGIRLTVELDEFVVMPSHIHGIVAIGKATVETARRGVSTPTGWKGSSLGSIVGQFKSACTKRIWAAGFHEFAWQPRFYDHIIRNEQSLDHIREYVVNNPLKWELEKDKPENLYM